MIWGKESDKGILDPLDMAGNELPREFWQPPWLLVGALLTGFSFAFLFLPAGRLDWVLGWLYVIALSASSCGSIVYLRRVNPEIFAARRRIHSGTKLWDKLLLCFLVPSFIAVFIVAALDEGRLHWSDLALWAIALGYALFAAGFTLFIWAEGVNRFFEPGVRIQTDRGHHVVDTGPYSYVRHPGYFGAILIFTGSALALGSLLALAPAFAASLLFILRTSWEDRTLQEELPGYKEYCQKVRCRMLPGIW